MAANGISTLPTKKARQDAMLAAEAAKRVTQGTRRSTLDATQLPSRYGTTNGAADYVDNPNLGGLVAGRPWT